MPPASWAEARLPRPRASDYLTTLGLPKSTLMLFLLLKLNPDQSVAQPRSAQPPDIFHLRGRRSCWGWTGAENRLRNQLELIKTHKLVAPVKVLRKGADKLAAMRHALLKTENFHFALSIPLWYMLSSRRLSIKTMFA